SRRRHTRSKRDWSSDVCSSDLLRDYKTNETMLLTEDQFMDYAAKLLKDNGRDEKPQQLQHARYLIEEYYATHEVTPMEEAVEIQIGRASCREGEERDERDGTQT